MRISLAVSFSFFLLSHSVLATETTAILKSKTLEQWSLEKSSLEKWSKEALQKTLSDLKRSGQISERAQTFFAAEVAAAPMVFVRNYEVTREATSVDVDSDRLKGFLNFHSSLLKGPSNDSQEICVAVHTLRPGAFQKPDNTSECPSCEAFAQLALISVSQLFERHGFRVVSGPSLARDSALNVERTVDDEVLRAQAQGCSAVFLAVVRSDTDASVEAGELTIDSYLQLRDHKQMRLRAQSSTRLSGAHVASTLSAQDPRQRLQLGVMIVAESAAELANRMTQEQQLIQPTGSQTEAFLVIQNIPDYQTFITARDRILGLVPGLELQERLLTSGGSVEFSFSSALQASVAQKLQNEVEQYGGVGGVAAKLLKTDPAADAANKDTAPKLIVHLGENTP